MSDYEVETVVRPGSQPERLLADGRPTGFYVTRVQSAQLQFRLHGGYSGWPIERDHLVVWDVDGRGVFAYTGYWATGVMMFARRVLGDNRASVRFL